MNHLLIRFLVVIGLIWILFALGLPIAHRISGADLTISDLGSWGESFGPFSALLAALAFGGVAYTALLQRQTLALQQHQITITVRDQQRQRFDSQFINLLQLLREVRKDVRFSYSEDYIYNSGFHIDQEGEHYTGLAAFRHAWTEMEWWLYGSDMEKEQVGAVYTRRIHNRFESNLGPYFRIVYTILQNIHESLLLSDLEKEKAGNLLRSQLTSDELILHGLNGLSAVSKNFGELITEFRLLKYMPDDSRRRLLGACYPPQAFEARADTISR